MKKLSLLAAICLMMNALNGMSQTTDAWPWDFPMSTGEQLTDGELILAPYTYYKVAIDDKEDLKRKGLIFYKTKLETAGSEKSVVNYMEDYELPNTLIIGLPEGATAKKGDILLTWWQSGSGMKRAIVRDDSNPAEPKVDYLDMTCDWIMTEPSRAWPREMPMSNSSPTRSSCCATESGHQEHRWPARMNATNGMPLH